MRSRFQARRASLRASGLDPIHSRAARLRSADGGPGRRTLEAGVYAPPLLGIATSGTSATAPPVIERIADHAGWAGRTLLQPARLWEDISPGRMA